MDYAVERYPYGTSGFVNEPTPHLRWSKDGRLQQHVIVKKVHPTGYVTETFGEWRDVPTETGE